MTERQVPVLEIVSGSEGSAVKRWVNLGSGDTLDTVPTRNLWPAHGLVISDAQGGLLGMALGLDTVLGRLATGGVAALSRADLYTLLRVIETSAGSADAGKIVKLDASGLLSTTVLPPAALGITNGANRGTVGSRVFVNRVGANLEFRRLRSLVQNTLSVTEGADHVDFNVFFSDGQAGGADRIWSSLKVETEIAVIAALANGKIANVVEDGSPALGGDLELGAFGLVSGAQELLRYVGGVVYVGGAPILIPDITDPQVNDVLTWDGAEWVNAPPAGGGAGESNTGSNRGFGVGVYDSKVGSELRFRSFLSGSPRLSIALDSGSGEITLDVVPETMNLGQLANVTTQGSTLGALLWYDGATQLWKVLPPGGEGQVLSIASGVPTWVDAPVTGLQSVEEDSSPALGGDLDIGANELVRGASPVISHDGTQVLVAGVPAFTPTIANPQDGEVVTYVTGSGWVNGPGGGSGAGESNTGQNEGTGEGVFKQKAGVVLEFKSVKAASAKAAITSDADHVLVDVVPAQLINDAGSGSGDIWSASKVQGLLDAKIATTANTGTGQGLANGKVGTAAQFKSLRGNSSKIAVTSSATEVLVDANPAALINDAGSGTGDIWSASKIAGLLAGKLGSLVQDLTPELGGDLDILAERVVSGVQELLRYDSGADKVYIAGAELLSPTITDPQVDDVLKYDGNGWVNGPGGSGAGEANTGENIGTGQPIFLQKVGTVLQFRGIKALSNKLAMSFNGTDVLADVRVDKLIDDTITTTLNIWSAGKTAGELAVLAALVAAKMSELQDDTSPILGGDLDIAGFRVMSGGQELLKYSGGIVYVGGVPVLAPDITNPQQGDVIGYDAGEWKNVAGGGGGAVSSVFGRSGAVVAAAGDYDAAEVSFGSGAGLSSTNVGAALDELQTEKAASSHTHGTADITDNAITNAKLRDSAALSVIGRVSNTSGDPADIAAAADGAVLRRSGSAIGFGEVATAGLADGAVTLAKLVDIATDSFLGRDTAGTGDPEVLTPAQARAILNVADGANVGIQNVVEDTTPQLGGHLDVNGHVLGDGTRELLAFVEDPSAVNHLEIENQATGGGPILRAVGDDANVDLNLTPKGSGRVVANVALQVVGGIIVSGTVDGRDVAADGTKLDGIEAGAAAPPYGTADLSNGAVTDAILRDSAALSVIGRATNSTGDPADIAAASDGHVLRRSGTSLGFGQVVSAGIGDDQIGDTKLRNSAALSVIGRSANSTGDPADIAAANDGEVLRRSGTTLGFGQVGTTGLADAGVTLAKLANIATARLLGRTTAGSGVPEELTAAQVRALLAVITPAFCAAYGPSSGPSLVVSTWTALGLATAQANRGGFTVGTDEIVVPAAGTYRITARATCTRSDTGSFNWAIKLRRKPSGGAYADIAGSETTGAGNGNGKSGSITTHSIVTSVGAGDAFQAQVMSDGSNSTAVTNGYWLEVTQLE